MYIHLLRHRLYLGQMVQHICAPTSFSLALNSLNRFWTLSSSARLYVPSQPSRVAPINFKTSSALNLINLIHHPFNYNSIWLQEPVNYLGYATVTSIPPLLITSIEIQPQPPQNPLQVVVEPLTYSLLFLPKL